MLGDNPKFHQEVQESFNRHIKDIFDGIITDFQVEISSFPLVCHNEHPVMMSREKPKITYEGYTQSDERFSLTIY